MDIIQKIIAVWQKIGIVQRIFLVTIVLTFISFSALLVHWARKPDMRMLYQGLSTEEAAQITEQISDQGIPYELRAGGTSIYVPNEHVYQLRLDMANEGLPTGDQGGYKIFDDDSIGTSPFIQNVNLKRALQDELAKSIQMIEGVTHARVHIVSSEETLFTSEAGKTTASVVLRLKPGYSVSALNIASITHLVSGSVEGLDSENVTVIDSQGRLLSNNSGNAIAGGAGTVQDYKERVEQNLQNKVEDMLTMVLGSGRASVKVHAVIDTNSISTVTEKYEPKGVASKEEITKGSETESAGSTEGATPSKKTDQTTITEYQIGKTVTQEVILPGEVKSLSVAAFVDLSPPDVNEADNQGTAAQIMEVSEVEEIITNALGLVDGRDSLKVVDVKFNRPTITLMDEEAAGLDFMAIARQASLGIMAVCALLVLRMFKSAGKKTQTGGKNATSPTEQTGGLLPSQTAISPMVLRQQIAGALERDPDKVRQLFTQWIEE